MPTSPVLWYFLQSAAGLVQLAAVFWLTGICVMNVDEALVIIKNQGLMVHSCDPSPRDGEVMASLGYRLRANPDGGRRELSPVLLTDRSSP